MPNRKEMSNNEFFAHKFCAFYIAALAAVQCKAPQKLQDQLVFQLENISKVLRVTPEQVKLGTDSIEVDIFDEHYAFKMEEIDDLVKELMISTQQYISAN